jgi:hypothetical protein
MSPVLGIIASSTQQGRGGGPISAYDALATVIVPSGGLATITFADIPTGYQHLQIRGMVLGSAAASGSLQARFNNDSGTNYTRHELGGNGTTAFYYATTGQTSANMYGYYDNISNSGFPCVFVMDLLDYANTNKNKTMKVLAGMDKNGSNYGEIFLKSSLWQSTSAISSVSIFIGGQNFAVNSSISLYGVK